MPLCNLKSTRVFRWRQDWWGKIKNNTIIHVVTPTWLQATSVKCGSGYTAEVSAEVVMAVCTRAPLLVVLTHRRLPILAGYHQLPKHCLFLMVSVSALGLRFPRLCSLSRAEVRLWSGEDLRWFCDCALPPSWGVLERPRWVREKEEEDKERRPQKCMFSLWICLFRDYLMEDLLCARHCSRSQSYSRDQTCGHLLMK